MTFEPLCLGFHKQKTTYLYSRFVYDIYTYLLDSINLYLILDLGFKTLCLLSHIFHLGLYVSLTEPSGLCSVAILHKPSIEIIFSEIKTGKHS